MDFTGFKMQKFCPLRFVEIVLECTCFRIVTIRKDIIIVSGFSISFSEIFCHRSENNQLPSRHFLAIFIIIFSDILHRTVEIESN